MTVYLGLSFLAITSAVLLLLNIGPSALRQVSTKEKRPSLQSLTVHKKQGRIQKYFQNVQTALKVTGQTGITYSLFFLSFLLILAGGISGISFGNPYLAPILGIALAAIPFLYVRVQYRNYKYLLLEELDTALSVVTSSYERTDNIVQSFEENLPYIREPLHGVFQRFLFRVQKAGFSINDAIDRMKDEVKQSSFWGWCDSLKRCSQNRILKSSLAPFAEDVTNILEEQAKAKNLLYESRKEFRSVLLFCGLYAVIKYVMIPYSFEMPIPENIKNLFMALDVCLAVISGIRIYFLTTDIALDTEREES